MVGDADAAAAATGSKPIPDSVMNDCDETTYLPEQLEITTKGHQYYFPRTSNKSVNFRLLHPSSLTASFALF